MRVMCALWFPNNIFQYILSSFSNYFKSRRRTTFNNDKHVGSTVPKFLNCLSPHTIRSHVLKNKCSNSQVYGFRLKRSDKRREGASTICVSRMMNGENINHHLSPWHHYYYHGFLREETLVCNLLLRDPWRYFLVIRLHSCLCKSLSNMKKRFRQIDKMGRLYLRRPNVTSSPDCRSRTTAEIKDISRDKVGASSR